MTVFRINKLTALPSAAAWTPSTVYVIPVGADSCEIYITNTAGDEVRKVSGGGDFLPLTGGFLTGDLEAEGLIRSTGVDKNVTLSAIGDYPTINFSLSNYQGGVTALPTLIQFSRLHSAGGDPSWIRLLNNLIEVNQKLKGITPAEADDPLILATKEYVDARPAYVMGRSTSTTHNINSSTSWTDAPLVEGGFDLTNALFEAVGTNGVRCLFDGWVECVAQAEFTSTGARVNPNLRIARDRGGAITSSGAVGASGYVRNASGHSESSLHVFDHIEVQSGDIIIGQTRQTAAATSCTLVSAGSGTLMVKRL